MIQKCISSHMIYLIYWYHREITLPLAACTQFVLDRFEGIPSIQTASIVDGMGHGISYTWNTHIRHNVRSSKDKVITHSVSMQYFIEWMRWLLFLWYNIHSKWNTNISIIVCHKSKCVLHNSTTACTYWLKLRITYHLWCNVKAIRKLPIHKSNGRVHWYALLCSSCDP